MAVAKCSGTGKAKGVLSIENAVRRKKNAGQEALYFFYFMVADVARFLRGLKKEIGL